LDRESTPQVPNLEKFLVLARGILAASPDILQRVVNAGVGPAAGVFAAFEPGQLDEGGALARRIRAYPAQAQRLVRNFQVTLGPGHVVASYCWHPLYTRSANISGASVPEAAARPNLRSCPRCRSR
jgi:hypothetical protein